MDRPISRRVFLRDGALALITLGGLPPAFLPRWLAAQPRAGGPRTLVFVFLRGAVDGLSVAVPFGEPAYYRVRRSIAIAPPGRPEGALDLNGFFGLHPALAPLARWYRGGQLAIVHAVGSPHPTRSHFEAQDYMETAAPGAHLREGWLNRVLQQTPRGRSLADGAAHAADHRWGQWGLALRGVAFGNTLPLALQGPHPALVLDPADRGASADDAALRLYRTDSGDLLARAAAEARDAARLLADLERHGPAPRPGVTYPPTPFGQALRQLARLLKAGAPVEVACVDLGGWDTHVAQGGADGALARRLQELARGLDAFAQDLDDRLADVLVLTASEFGRTVAENGSGGTDHGHGNVMLLLGGTVLGGRVHGRWPGLEPEALHEGRDLAVTTDFRDVFAEAALRHLGAQAPERLFPGYPVDPRRFLGVVG